MLHFLRAFADADEHASAGARYRLSASIDHHCLDLIRTGGPNAVGDHLRSAYQAACRGDDPTVIESHLRAHLDDCRHSVTRGGAHDERDDQPLNDTERRYGLGESPA
jgi:hypothetical protein